MLYHTYFTTIKKISWVLVAHTCNPGYSEGRDQEDCSSKPAWANSAQDPISKKKPFTEKGWWSGSSGNS
jgi:hypothetical protein